MKVQAYIHSLKDAEITEIIKAEEDQETILSSSAKNK